MVFIEFYRFNVSVGGIHELTVFNRRELYRRSIKILEVSINSVLTGLYSEDVLRRRRGSVRR